MNAPHVQHEADASGRRCRRAGRRGIIQAMQHPNGDFRMPAFSVRFDGAPPPVKPSPLLGEHTTQVFGEWLGMSTSDIAGLAASMQRLRPAALAA